MSVHFTASPSARDRGWGVYCLANDAVLDWTLALLESLAEFAPELPLLVIPYDGRQERLARELAARGHGYLDHPETERLHELGRRFYPDDDFAARGFRKLAAFSGPFERFFACDSDVLALSPLAALCEAIAGCDADLVCFDTDPDQVWRLGPMRSALEATSAPTAFNAGLFAARRAGLDAGRLAGALADLGSDWRLHLVPNAEQPFLNLYAARAAWRVARAHELVPDACSTCWPAVGRLEREGESWRLRDSGRWDEGWRFLFAHWAGFRLSPAMPNRALWESYRARAG